MLEAPIPRRASDRVVPIEEVVMPGQSVNEMILPDEVQIYAAADPIQDDDFSVFNFEPIEQDTHENCDRTTLNELSDRVSLALIERDSHLLYLGRITANQNDHRYVSFAENSDDMTNKELDEDLKPEMLPIREISNTNLNRIISLLNEPEAINQVIDEECVMTYTHFPEPWEATDDGLFKREIDDISGNMPFFSTVNILIYSYSSSHYTPKIRD